MKRGIARANNETVAYLETDTDRYYVREKNGIREILVEPKQQIQLIDISRKKKKCTRRQADVHSKKLSILLSDIMEVLSND